MKRAKRFISIVLTMLLMINLLPATALAGTEGDNEEHTNHPICGVTSSCVNPDHANDNHGDDIEWEKWTSNKYLPSSPGYYYLTSDVELSYTWDPEDGTYLCLNGYDIYPNAEKAQKKQEFRDIRINTGVKLTITDCHTGDDAGKIRGLNTDNDYVPDDVKKDCGGVVFNSHDSSTTSFCIYNISICNNTAALPTSGNGGGVYVQYGTFSMYGATIKNNRASANGGGIYLYKWSTVNIYDSTIKDNKSSETGGAIYVWADGDNQSKVNITGATITGNSAKKSSGGMYAGDKGTTLNFKGSIKIADNTIIGDDSEAEASNINLEKDGKITLTGALSSDSHIGISSSSTSTTAIISGWHKYMCSDTDNHAASVFVADDSGYVVQENSSGKLGIVEKNHTWSDGWTYDDSGHYHTCTNVGCSITKGDYDAHNVDGAGYEEHKIVSNDTATCTASGTKTDECTVCGYSKEEQSDALGHDYKYSADGAVITKTCSRCDFSETATISVDDSVSKEYTGSPIEAAKVEYSDNWGTDKNLKITYDNNKNASTDNSKATASITIEGATASVTYEIEPKNIYNANVTLDRYTTVYYTGEEQTWTVTEVTVGDLTLSEDDYTVSGNTAINKGMHELTVTGKGNYTGNKTCTYEILLAPATHTHDWSSGWIYDKDGHYHQCMAPDCTISGNDTSNNPTYTGHISGEPTIKPATCTTSGKKTYKCTECGYTTKEETIDALGHDYVYSADGAVITQTCSRCDSTATATISVDDSVSKEYTGSPIEAAKVGYSDNWGTDTNYEIKYENNIDVSTDNSKATASITIEGKTASVTYDIVKATSSIKTAPTAINDLVYTGYEMILITAGSANGGTLWYKLGENGTYSDTVTPTAKDVGEYKVYYKVVGDVNHNDTEEQSIVVEIKAASDNTSDGNEGGTPGGNESTTPGGNESTTPDGNESTTPGGNESTTPGGNESTTPDGNESTTPDGNESTTPGGNESTTPDGNESTTPDGNESTTPDESGTTTPEETGKTVAQIETEPAAVSGLAYNGQAQALITEGKTSDGTLQYKLGADGTYAVSIPTAANAGTYTVYYKVVGDSSHSDSAEQSISVTIAKAPLTIRANNKTITYGDEPANAGVTYEGFVNGENESVLNGELSYAYNYNKNDKTGTYTITPSGLSADNYEITCATGTLTVQPKQVVNTVSVNGTPEEGVKIAVNNGIDSLKVTDAMKKNDPSLNSSVDIKNKLLNEVLLQWKITQSDTTVDNVAYYDIALQIYDYASGQWVDATMDNFPSDGKLTVMIPYPEAVRDNYNNYDFTVSHMFSIDAFGKKAGDVETPTVTPTQNGLQFAVTGLSPIVVGWMEKASVSNDTSASDDKDVSEDTTESATEESISVLSPATGDTTNVAGAFYILLIAAALIASDSICRIRRRK